MNRALRAATMGVLLLSPVALSACSAGQVTQTETQDRDKTGPSARVGDLELREVLLAYPTGGRYVEGAQIEPAQDGVVLQQVSLSVIIEQVVEGDDLGVSTRGEQSAVEVAANAAETIDTNTNGHDQDLLRVFQVPRPGPNPTLTNSDPARQGRWALVCVDLLEPAALLLVEHLSAEICLGVGYTQLRRPLISSSEQSSDPSRHRVFRQGRFMHLTKLLEAGLLVLDA